MRRKIQETEYAALAELRYRIRQFIHGSDQAARAVGLEPQQYQLLLALRALRKGDARIRCLAERLYLRHHTVVGAVDRLESNGYVRRRRSPTDHREVLVVLSPKGRSALDKVAMKRLHELRESGHALVAALSTILSTSGASDLGSRHRKAAILRHNKISSRLR